jgi:hypothetical protein
MLIQVLREIKTSQSTLNLDDLGRKLGVERSALQGMIDYWVRKGRLQDDQEMAITPDICTSVGCAGSCTGSRNCSFKVKMPKTYSIS